MMSYLKLWVISGLAMVFSILGISEPKYRDRVSEETTYPQEVGACPLKYVMVDGDVAEVIY